MTHTCHARNCDKEVKPELLMCLKHWKMVPKKLQKQVWKYYRPGQCYDKNPSWQWLASARLAIEAVAEQEKGNYLFNR